MPPIAVPVPTPMMALREWLPSTEEVSNGGMIVDVIEPGDPPRMEGSCKLPRNSAR
jgi:hypothetical protein